MSSNDGEIFTVMPEVVRVKRVSNVKVKPYDVFVIGHKIVQHKKRLKPLTVKYLIGVAKKAGFETFEVNYRVNKSGNLTSTKITYTDVKNGLCKIDPTYNSIVITEIASLR